MHYIWIKNTPVIEPKHNGIFDLHILLGAFYFGSDIGNCDFRTYEHKLHIFHDDVVSSKIRKVWMWGILVGMWDILVGMWYILVGMWIISKLMSKI